MSTDRAPVPSHSLPIGFLLVLVVAVFLYVGMVACLGDVHNPNNDAFGRGLAAAFGALLGLIVWILLGVLLLIGWVKGEMPRPATTAAFILLPLSAIAAAIAIDPAPDWPWWLPLVPFLLPPPLAAFAIWARFPALHRALAPNPTSAVLLGIVLALTIAPIPSYVADQMRRAEDARRAEAVRQAEKSAEEARQAENLARFQKLTSGLAAMGMGAVYRQEQRARRRCRRRRESADPPPVRRRRGAAPRLRVSARHL